MGGGVWHRAGAVRAADGLGIPPGRQGLITGPIGTGRRTSRERSTWRPPVAASTGADSASPRAVAFAADLVRARDDPTLSRLHERYDRNSPLTTDAPGFVPFTCAGDELLFTLLADRARAPVDRLGHRTRVLTTLGPSYGTRAQSAWERRTAKRRRTLPDVRARPDSRTGGDTDGAADVGFRH